MVILFMIMESILISVYSLKLISFMHAKMGLIKDRNDMNLTEAEDIKRWQEYTEELYSKDLDNLDNHYGASLT